MSFQIAIDGPAGAGKSTIARIVARKLGALYIDTGAMYRAIGLFYADHGIPIDDEQAVETALHEADVDLCILDGEQHVLLNGEDVNGRIRSEEAGMAASKVSTYRAVRRKLVERQQEIAGTLDVVMDGRDIGTVVLKDAQLKIFLTAAPRVRAQRRLQDLLDRGQTADIDEIERDIRDRDKQDMNRAESPLRQAEDAVLVDTSDMTIDEVAQKILDLAADVKGRLGL